MKFAFSVSRQFLLIGAYGFLALTSAAQAEAELPAVTMMKDPFCGCCDAWADHMRAAGFHVSVKNEPNMEQVKAKLGVAPQITSCHTAVVDGYVIEGHVPASAVKKLLTEKPSARGLTVPGMPMGSPGMEVDGQKPDRYNVLLFNNDKVQRFESYEGNKAL